MDYVLIGFVGQVTVFFSLIVISEGLRKSRKLKLRGLRIAEKRIEKPVWRKAS